MKAPKECLKLDNTSRIILDRKASLSFRLRISRTPAPTTPRSRGLFAKYYLGLSLLFILPFAPTTLFSQLPPKTPSHSPHSSSPPRNSLIESLSLVSLNHSLPNPLSSSSPFPTMTAWPMSRLPPTERTPSACIPFLGFQGLETILM